MAASSWITRGEHVSNLDGDDFQQFCLELLDFEVAHRHVGGRVGGPPPKYRGDKGMDLSVEIASPPRIPKIDFPHALTEDTQGLTCVSCKSGASWAKALRKDAWEKPAPVEVLRNGGHFTMLVNQQVPEEPDTRKILQGVTCFLARQLGVDTDEVRPRIHFYDADDLAGFLAHHPIGLDPVTRGLLKVPELGGLQIFLEWREFLGHDRSLPSFCPDKPRETALGQIEGVLSRISPDRRAQVVWVYGAPGVGKSRLVLEAVQRTPGARQRLLAASSFEPGRTAVLESDVPFYNDVVLIVDDCPPSEAQAISSPFLARARNNNGTLVLIGPQEGVDDPPRFSGLALRVKPLEERASRQLVEQELAIGPGERSPTVQRVLRLAEGYPWFAILLAREIREDEQVLPEGAGQWEAASLAIAGSVKEYGNDARWQGEVLLRAKTLLAVLLTDGLDWSLLDADDEKRLSEALEAPWSDIKRTADACRRRGIIRVRQNWKYKYVTPNNLARLVAIFLFQPPYSLGKRIRRYIPEVKAALYRRLEVLEVGPSVLSDLAQEELERLWENQLPFDRFSSGGTTDVPLLFTARWQPAATARALRKLIESASLDGLRKRTDVRRDLVFALEHISRRREGFEDAEAALFRLAMAENESWANNATGVWSGLFHTALNLTHRTTAARLAILRERLKTGTTESRLVALVGLGIATGAEQVGPGYSSEDTVDGPWVTPTFGEVRAAKRDCWQLLRTIMADTDPAIARQAREIARENLRAAIRWGLGSFALDALQSAVGGWDEDELAQLRRELDFVKTYEGEMLERDQELASAVDRLSKEVVPRRFHDRLVDVVGHWLPGDQRIGADERIRYDETLDRGLAAEGLASPILLVNELQWLDTEKAVRSVPFMIQVAILDSARVLLEPLVDRARAGGAADTLSAYLAGLARAGTEEEVDRLLRKWRIDRRLALHTLLTVWRVGATDERIGWIIEDLEEGRLEPQATNCLTLGSWGRRGSAHAITKLIYILSELEDPTAQLTALQLLMDRTAVASSEVAALEPALIGLIGRLASQRLTGMASYFWEQGCKLALSRDHINVIIEAAINAVRFAEDYGADHGWNILMEALKVDPVSVWNALVPIIESRDKDSYRVILQAEEHGIVSGVPVDVIMNWVGSDLRRSLLIAQMCSAHESPLNEVARHLIIRFGADSPAGRALSARAHSTQGVVSGGLSSFFETQLEHAKEWARDPARQVAEWGNALVRQFEASLEAESAREEFEERHGL